MTLSTTQFTISDNTFSADDSELSRGGSIQYLIQAYPDSIDLGFDMVSIKTGHVSRWVQNHVEMVMDDITYWEYVPTAETLRKFPQLKNWKVQIYND